MAKTKYILLTREGKPNYYSRDCDWLKKLIRIAARRVLYVMTEEEIDQVDAQFDGLLRATGKRKFENREWRELFAEAMADYPEVLTAFLAAHQKENADYYEEICDEMSRIVMDGDQSNGSVDSSLSSSKRALIVDRLS